VDTRYEFYGEEHGRVKVDTYSLLFEKQIFEAVTARGEVVYDGISGATPTGSPPFVTGSNTNHVPLAKTSDIRRAENLALDCRWAGHTLSPQIAYSKENDYKSIAISLSDAIDFNEKNTTLRLGVAHNFDGVLDSSSPRVYRNKDTTDGIIGVSQVLTRYTVLTADFGYGRDLGYLNDPYKKIRFDGFLPITALNPENRPSHRTRQTALLTLTQFVKPMDASAELSYRAYYDSYDVLGHTVALTWHQKLGPCLLLEPTFRYYNQSAASFYRLSVPGYSPLDGDPTRPKYYSADYRLSRLETFTFGAQAVLRMSDWLSFDIGYQRYAMYGLDNKTSDTAYPKANILTGEVRLWF
jgi:hypothetical protein